MYKKITTNIVEEHFDHPEAVSMKGFMDSVTPGPHHLVPHPPMPMPMPMPQPESDAGAPPEMRMRMGMPPGMFRPQLMEPQSLTKLKMDTREYFADEAWRLRIFLVNLANAAANEELPEVEAYVLKNVDILGEIVKPMYGDATGTELNQYMRAFVTTIINTLKAVKAGTSTVELQAATATNISNLVQLFNRISPTFMHVGTLTDLLTVIANSWSEQLTAQIAKEWGKDLAASDIAMGNTIYGKAGLPSLADYVARGIFNQSY